MTVILTDEEARALRAYVLGDSFDTDPLDSSLKKCEALPYEDICEDCGYATDHFGGACACV